MKRICISVSIFSYIARITCKCMNLRALVITTYNSSFFNIILSESIGYQSYVFSTTLYVILIN